MSVGARPAQSLIGRIWRAYTAPALSWGEEWRAAPGEGRLAAFAYGAAFFITLRRLLAGPTPGAEDGVAWIAATVFIGFSFGVLALYAVAAAIRLICRLLGGEGGWAATRLALFWSGLAAGPVALILAAVGGLMGAPGAGAVAAGLIWAALFAPMLAAAHGFDARKTALVFVALAIAAFAAAAL